MFEPVQLTPERTTIMLAMLAFLAVTFVGYTYRYTTGSETAQQYYLMVLMVSGLAVYGLQQVRPLFSGWAETAVQALWYVAILLFPVAVIQVWRYRDTQS